MSSRQLTGRPPAKLLVLSSFLSRRYAGAAHATLTILRGFARQGREDVHAFAFEVDDGVVPESVALLVGEAPRSRRFLWRFPSVGAVGDLSARLAVARLPEVDLCYTQHTALGLAFRRLFPRTPVISHTGAMLPDREYEEESGRPRWEAAIEGRLINRLEDQAYREPNWTHFVSTPLVASQRERHYGLPPGFFTIVPLPVDTDRLQAGAGQPDLRLDLGIPRNAAVIACVARLVKLKQIDRLLAAVAHCAARPWLIVAGDGPEAGPLREQAAGLGIADRVRFTGRVDPAPVLAASDLFALPSRLESFGLAYAEAMMMGLPAVALSNDWPGALTAGPDVIVHGETGYCVSSQEALVAALQKLAADPVLRERLGRNAREHAERNFGFHQYAARVRAVLDGPPLNGGVTTKSVAAKRA